MPEVDAGCHLVDMLTSFAVRSDKPFLNIFFEDAEAFQFYFEGLLFFRAYGKHDC
jgi:hypothetical protein